MKRVELSVHNQALKKNKTKYKIHCKVYSALSFFQNMRKPSLEVLFVYYKTYIIAWEELYFSSL